jgi:hypothetical protein
MEGAERFVPVHEILDQFNPYSEAVSEESVTAHAQAVFRTRIQAHDPPIALEGDRVPRLVVLRDRLPHGPLPRRLDDLGEGR